MPRSMRLFLATFLVLLPGLGCKPKFSNLEAITGNVNGVKNAFMILALRPHDNQSINAKPVLGIVECTDNPDFWTYQLEAAAAVGVAYANYTISPQRIYIPLKRNQPDPTPCTIVAGSPAIDVTKLRLLSRKVEELASRQSLSGDDEKLYKVAQTFFLAMRGAYGGANNGARQIMQFATMLGMSLDEIKGMLTSKDPVYNPCWRPEGGLAANYPGWADEVREKFYFCEAIANKPGLFNYGVRDSAGGYSAVLQDLITEINSVGSAVAASSSGSESGSFALYEVNISTPGAASSSSGQPVSAASVPKKVDSSAFPGVNQQFPTNSGRTTVESYRPANVSSNGNVGITPNVVYQEQRSTFTNNGQSVRVSQFDPLAPNGQVPSVSTPVSLQRTSVVQGPNNSQTAFYRGEQGAFGSVETRQDGSRQSQWFTPVQIPGQGDKTYVAAMGAGAVSDDGQVRSFPLMETQRQSDGSYKHVAAGFLIQNGNQQRVVTTPIQEVRSTTTPGVTELQMTNRDKLVADTRQAWGDVGATDPAAVSSVMRQTAGEAQNIYRVPQNDQAMDAVIAAYDPKTFTIPAPVVTPGPNGPTITPAPNGQTVAQNNQPLASFLSSTDLPVDNTPRVARVIPGELGNNDTEVFAPQGVDISRFGTAARDADINKWIADQRQRLDEEQMRLRDPQTISEGQGSIIGVGQRRTQSDIDADRKKLLALETSQNQYRSQALQDQERKFAIQVACANGSMSSVDCRTHGGFDTATYQELRADYQRYQAGDANSQYGAIERRRNQLFQEAQQNNELARQRQRITLNADGTIKNVEWADGSVPMEQRMHTSWRQQQYENGQHLAGKGYVFGEDAYGNYSWLPQSQVDTMRAGGARFTLWKP